MLYFFWAIFFLFSYARLILFFIKKNIIQLVPGEEIKPTAKKVICNIIRIIFVTKIILTLFIFFVICHNYFYDVLPTWIFIALNQILFNEIEIKYYMKYIEKKIKEIDEAIEKTEKAIEENKSK